MDLATISQEQIESLLSANAGAIDAEFKRRAKDNFRAFIAYANPRFEFYGHAAHLINVLERVAAGEIKRLMILLPPRHSKSELMSRLFSAYYLLRNPHHFVGLTSYSAELAGTLSRAARDNFIACGGDIRQDVMSVTHWQTTQGGGMWSAGVGGSITGKGFHLGIIDDPVKGSEEASSELMRKKQKEWFSSTFETRTEPNAAIVVIQTRWHEDDLSGWLLEQERNSEPEHWHVVCFPALYEDLTDFDFPETCTVEPDFRTELGQALCPERYPKELLERRKAKDGYTFDALYQQRPSAKEGSFFRVDMLEIIDIVPAQARRVRGWDKAASEGRGDYTVGVKMSATPDGMFYIEDVKRGRWDTSTRDRMIRLTAEMDGRPVIQIAEQEGGSGGKESALNFIKLLSGYIATTEPSARSKEQRADAFSSQLNAGNVKLLRGDWNHDYVEELRTFPNGRHDDQIDASSLAFKHLNNGVIITDAEREVFRRLAGR